MIRTAQRGLSMNTGFSVQQRRNARLCMIITEPVSVSAINHYVDNWFNGFYRDLHRLSRAHSNRPYCKFCPLSIWLSYRAISLRTKWCKKQRCECSQLKKQLFLYKVRLALRSAGMSTLGQCISLFF